MLILAGAMVLSFNAWAVVRMIQNKMTRFEFAYITLAVMGTFVTILFIEGKGSSLLVGAAAGICGYAIRYIYKNTQRADESGAHERIDA